MQRRFDTFTNLSYSKKRGGINVLRILICDDNAIHAEEIQFLIQKLLPKDFTVSFLKANSKEECIRAIEKELNQSWIIFMDIVLEGGINGIQIAKEIQSILPTAQLIFVTGEIAWCTKVGQADPIYFLTKPIDEQDLKFALKKALRNLKQNRLFFSIKGKNFSIQISDILYAERNLRQTKIYTKNGEILQVTNKIEEILESLDPIEFISPHKSYLVNLQYVTSITSQSMMICDEIYIPISHAKSPEIKQKYLNYVSCLI